MDAPCSLKPPLSICSQIRCPGLIKGFPCGLAGKESTCNAGNLDSIPGLERSPGEEKGYPLQYSGLENSLAGSPWGPIKCGYRFELWPKECRRKCCPFLPGRAYSTSTRRDSFPLSSRWRRKSNRELQGPSKG